MSTSVLTWIPPHITNYRNWMFAQLPLPHLSGQCSHVTETQKQISQFSRVQLFSTPWTAAHQASLSITNSWSLLTLTAIESVMSSNHLILCLQSFPESSCLQCFPASGSFPVSQFFELGAPKHWSFSFSPSNEYSGLISFRIDWFDLPAVQEILRSHLQYQSSKVSILWRSAFFMVQLISIHDYWKNHSFDYMDLCWQSNVSAFYMLSRLAKLFFKGASVF